MEVFGVVVSVCQWGREEGVERLRGGMYIPVKLYLWLVVILIVYEFCGRGSSSWWWGGCFVCHLVFFFGILELLQMIYIVIAWLFCFWKSIEETVGGEKG